MRILCLLLASLGCSPTASDLHPLESALGAAATLGSISSIALDAMSTSTICAEVTEPCGAYPCSNGTVTVALGSGCPLPLGGEASGTVNVSGSWQTATSASLSSTFVGVKAGTRNAVVVSSHDLSVSSSGNEVTVSYLGQNVDVQSGLSTLDSQSSWTVTVDQNGTPGDPSDDKLTINGTDQGVSSTVQQLNASSVVVDPSCHLNPISGTATLQKVSTITIVQTNVTFHAACDGKADTDSGGSVSLNFLQ